jgi:hypothetical protein
MMTPKFIHSRPEGRSSRRLIFCSLLILSVWVASATADTVYLKNGRNIEGLVKKESAEGVELDVGFGTIKFRPDEIEQIRKSSPEESSTIYQKWEEKRLEDRERQEAQKLNQPEQFQSKPVNVQYEKGQIMVEALLNKKVYS